MRRSPASQRRVRHSFLTVEGVGDHNPPQLRSQTELAFVVKLKFATNEMAWWRSLRIGPTLGGWITDNYDWRWIFFINMPVGLLSLFLTSTVVEDSGAPPIAGSPEPSPASLFLVGLLTVSLSVFVKTRLRG